MKTLEKELEKFLEAYETEAKFLEPEDFKVSYPTALDMELSQALLIRKDLNAYRDLPEELKERIRKSDEKFIRIWNEVKNLKTKNPHVKRAIKVLELLAREITKNPF